MTIFSSRALKPILSKLANDAAQKCFLVSTPENDFMKTLDMRQYAKSIMNRREIRAVIMLADGLALSSIRKCENLYQLG